MLLEYALIDLKKKEFERLPIRDGKKIREKMRDILLRDEIITDIEKKVINHDFSDSDVQYFDSINKNIQKHLKEKGLHLNG